MRLKLNRAAVLTLTGTAILATLSQVGGAADRCLVTTSNEVKADDLILHPATEDQITNIATQDGARKTGAGYTYLPEKETPLIADTTVDEITPQLSHSINNNLIIDTNYMYNAPQRYSVSFTSILPKEIHKGDKILLLSLSRYLNFDGSYKNDPNNYLFQKLIHGDLDFTINGEPIGKISTTNNNKGMDIYLTVTKDKTYVNKPQGKVTLENLFSVGDNIGFQLLNKLNLNSNYFIAYLVGNKFINEQLNTGDFNPTPLNHNSSYGYPSMIWHGTQIQQDIFNNVIQIPDDNFGNAGDKNAWKDNINNFKLANETDYAVRLSGVNLPKKFKAAWNWYNIPIVDPKGVVLSNTLSRRDTSPSMWSVPSNNDLPAVQLPDNLNKDEALNKTPVDHMGYSKQSDGSIILTLKENPANHKLDRNQVTQIIKDSIVYNLVYHDPSDRQKLIDNTLKYIFDSPLQGITPINYIRLSWEDSPDVFDQDKAQLYYVTNLTSQGLPGTTKGIAVPNNISFNAELYKIAQVHYLDSSNKDTQVANDSIMGTKNNTTDYKLNIPKGYVLDTKSGKNKDGTQYKWSADKKLIAYTFNEDQKLNDANPINIYITHGTHNTNDNSGKSTRTIQYTGLPDNLKPKDNVQTVLFKRSGVTDDVTGETTYGDWQPQSGNGHYTAVTSPTFAGYKPDQAVVPDTAATAGKDETVTVNYSRTDQNAKLTVHDDTTNTDLNDYAENSTGLYQDQINFKTAPSAVEQELKDKGYNIVSDSFKDSPTYNADDSKNNFVIHVTHKIVPVTPEQPKTPTDVIPDTKQHYPTGVDTNDLNKDVQRSIFYKYEDNSQAEPTVLQKAHFSRTVKVDAVTQKIVDNGTWATKDNYPEVATKSIDGYTPDKTKVDSATPSMTNNQDQTVVYHANDEDAAITYIDDTTGKVLKTDTQKAKYKQTIKFATDPNTQIQTYKDQGYVLVSSDWKDGSTYQTDPTKNKFTVHLKHGTSTVTPDKPKKPTDIIPGTKQHYPTGVDTNDLNQPQQRQITYTYADSKKQASPTVTQKATFHRTATVDNVTGKTTYTDWTTSDQYPEVKSPTIEGYTPNKSNVPVTKPELNTKQDVAVIYNPNPEQVDVIAKDNTGKQLSKSTLHGNYNTDYSATTPVIKGYHLIKMPTNTHGTYKTHNDPIIYIYAPDSNSVPEQADGTPKPDKSSYPDDITPAKRSNKLPETGSINLSSELNSVANQITHTLINLLH